MTSKTNSKNMSSHAGRSREHKATLGSDSEDSFSDDFNSIGGRGGQKALVNVDCNRLGKDNFDGRKGKRAMVIFGELFATEDDYELTWEGEPQEVVLSWGTNCNLAEEEGICCDNGSGWAGWDNKEKCYLRYDRSILDNEHAMRIIALETSSHKSAKSKDKKSKDKKSKDKKSKDKKSRERVEKKRHKRTADDEEKHCDLLSEREACDKNAADALTKKKAEAVKAKKAISSTLLASDDSEDDGPIPPRSKASRSSASSSKSDSKEEEGEEKEEATLGCSWEFNRGNNKGTTCGKDCEAGEAYCKKHAKSVTEKKERKSHEKKIENSDISDSEGSSMTSTTASKNMVSALTEALGKIFTGALKDKYAQRAIAALQDEKTQETLVALVQEKMPIKVIKAVSKRGKHRKRDPNAPKNNCSSYIFFCKNARAGVKAEHKDWKGTEVTKELGRIWREEMSDEDKAPFIRQAEQDKERYQEEMKDYTPSPEWLAQQEADDSDSGSKKKRSKKKNKGPKRAMSAYLYFCQDMRQKVKDENGDMKASEVTAELGRIWRDEVKDDKDASKKYYEQAKADKALYEEEKANWVDPEPASDEEEKATPKPKKKSSKKVKAVSSDSESDDSDSSSPKPKKKSSKKKKTPSAFTIFCQQTRPEIHAEHNDWDARQVTAELGRIWAEMDSEEQAEYGNM